MRLEFDNEAEAQACADKIHADLIDTNSEYAASVAAGLTLRWAIPYQDKDESGNVLGPSWYVNVKERCDPVLSAKQKRDRISFASRT